MHCDYLVFSAECPRRMWQAAMFGSLEAAVLEWAVGEVGISTTI